MSPPEYEGILQENSEISGLSCSLLHKKLNSDMQILLVIWLLTNYLLEKLSFHLSYSPEAPVSP